DHLQRLEQTHPNEQTAYVLCKAIVFPTGLSTSLWFPRSRIRLARGGPAAGPSRYQSLWRSHREVGPRQKPSSWQGPLVFPSQRCGILRPDVEHAELLAWPLPSTLRASGEKTDLKGLGRTIPPYRAVPMPAPDPVVPQRRLLLVSSLQVSRPLHRHPIRTLQRLDEHALRGGRECRFRSPSRGLGLHLECSLPEATRP